MFRLLQNIKCTIGLFCFIVLSACGPKVVLPSIPQDQLIEILCDVHIMEGALQNRPKRDKDSIAVAYYNLVYEKHQITEAEFLSSLERLEANPKLMSKIYSQILIRLDTMEKVSYKDLLKKK